MAPGPHAWSPGETRDTNCGAILADIPQIPGLLSAIFRLIEAHRNEIRAQPASFAANRSGCSPCGSGTRGFAIDLSGTPADLQCVGDDRSPAGSSRDPRNRRGALTSGKIAEEDAKRPNRERECLVKERTRLVNRMKGALARLGIRNFRPTLRNAAEHLAGLHTPEGSPLPPNVAAELERDIARLGLVIGQIKQIETRRPVNVGFWQIVF